MDSFLTWSREWRLSVSSTAINNDQHATASKLSKTDPESLTHSVNTKQRFVQHVNSLGHINVTTVNNADNAMLTKWALFYSLSQWLTTPTMQYSSCLTNSLDIFSQRSTTIALAHSSLWNEVLKRNNQPSRTGQTIRQADHVTQSDKLIMWHNQASGTG